MDNLQKVEFVDADAQEDFREIPGFGVAGAAPAPAPRAAAGLSKSDKRRHLRDLTRGIPVVGFTGVNGAGKTMLAVESAIAQMARGRTVYSTVPIESPWGNSLPILSIRQLLELENCTVLLDEVSVIFSSRTTQSLPPEVVAFLQTLRHKGITVMWTAPGWMRCDVLLRQSTQANVNVTPLIRFSAGGSPWPTPLVSLVGVLDTTDGATDEKPTRVMRRRLLVPRRSFALGRYDTHSDTPLLGRHLQSGTCVDCGGTVARERHSAERHAALGLPWFPEVVAHSEAHAPIARGIPGDGAVQGGTSRSDREAPLHGVGTGGTLSDRGGSRT